MRRREGVEASEASVQGSIDILLPFPVDSIQIILGPPEHAAAFNSNVFTRGEGFEARMRTASMIFPLPANLC